MHKILFAGIAIGAALTQHAFAADAVLTWNANAGVAATKACLAPDDNPFHESHTYAMMHIAVHDALNAIDRRYQPHTYNQKAEPGASSDAAVAAAAHDVLVALIKQLPAELLKPTCIDDGVASVESAYTAALGAIPDSPGKTQGIAVGKAAAAAILTARANDNSTNGPFLNKTCPPAQPGRFQCVPQFPFVAFEKWENVTPFVLQNKEQFRPGPPYRDHRREIQDRPPMRCRSSVGSGDKNAERPDTGSDANRAVLAGKLTAEMEPHRAHRGDEQGNQPVGDWAGYSRCSIWRWPMATSPWPRRRITTISGGRSRAIQSGGDPTWTPLRLTPPGPDYPSGHAIQGGAGASVLALTFGDQTSFQDCGVLLETGNTCADPKPVMRTYTSFTQAAEDNAAIFAHLGGLPLPQRDGRRHGLWAEDWPAGRYAPVTGEIG